MKKEQEIQIASGIPRRLLITAKETARLLEQSEQTLANDRCAGRGLPYIKLGRSVRYLISDVLSHVKARRIDPENRT